MRHLNRFTVEFFMFFIVSLIIIVFASKFCVQYINKKELSKLLSSIGCALVSILIFIFFTMPYCKDLPLYIQGEWIEAEITTLSRDITGTGRAGEYREIRVVDNVTGEEFKLHFFTKEYINKGDVYRIKYLPNTKIAGIIEVIYSSE